MATEDTRPSKWEEKSRQTRRIHYTCTLYMSKPRQKQPFIFSLFLTLLELKDYFFLLIRLRHSNILVVAALATGKSPLIEQLQDLRGIRAAVRESTGPKKSQILISSVRFQGVGMQLDLRGGANSAQENAGGRASGEPLMRENNLDINKDFNGFVPSLFWSLIQSPVKSIEGLQLGFR